MADLDIAIIGAGFSGLGMAMALERQGRHRYTVYERADTLGGTWRDNTYPGAACDIPSHLYCYSWAPNPNWTRAYAEQAEILDYLVRCAKETRVADHIRYSCEITSARYDETSCRWQLRTATGDRIHTDALITATGQLSQPHIPQIAGLDVFGGTVFHSATWNHDHDLSGRRVAVVGNGASAIQFIPHVAWAADAVTIFQRSPNFITPKDDVEFGPGRHQLFRRMPLLNRLYRLSLYLRQERRWFMFRSHSRANREATRLMSQVAESMVSDRLPRTAVVPDFPIGCKRVLISNDYYPALAEAHVHVVEAPIDHVEHEALVTADGRRHVCDTIIFGTGFQATRFLGDMEVTGFNGRRLDATWSDGACAHVGVTVPGFPNLFMLYGPNTNLGHNSILLMVERQIRYVLRCLRWLHNEDAQSVEIRADVAAGFDRHLTARLNRSVWAERCTSWYKTATGRITQNWPGTTVGYWLATTLVRRRHFVFRRRAEPPNQ